MSILKMFPRRAHLLYWLYLHWPFKWGRYWLAEKGADAFVSCFDFSAWREE